MHFRINEHFPPPSSVYPIFKRKKIPAGPSQSSHFVHQDIEDCVCEEQLVVHTKHCQVLYHQGRLIVLHMDYHQLELSKN